jgi:hypothetical protein
LQCRHIAIGRVHTDLQRDAEQYLCRRNERSRDLLAANGGSSPAWCVRSSFGGEKLHLRHQDRRKSGLLGLKYRQRRDAACWVIYASCRGMGDGLWSPIQSIHRVLGNPSGGRAGPGWHIYPGSAGRDGCMWTGCWRHNLMLRRAEGACGHLHQHSGRLDRRYVRRSR